jgi:hypothetical protein
VTITVERVRVTPRGLRQPAAIFVGEGDCGCAVEPAFEFANRHEATSAASYDAKLWQDVLVEEVAGHADRLGGLGR